MWYWNDGMGWWMMFGGISMLFFWSAVVALVIWGISRITGRDDSCTSLADRRAPLDIAKARYTECQISQEEFEQMKKNLS